MAIKGSLKEASLADVCQLLAMGQKTGCLSVTDRTRFGQIFFEHGRIIYAAIVNRRDRLGDLLVRDGLITAEQLRGVVDSQDGEPDTRLGQLLIRNGLITAEQLERYIRRQIERAVYTLFTWSNGNFYFEVDQRPSDMELTVSVSPESLLLEAARRVDEWELIQEKIPSLDLAFRLDRIRFDAADVELTPEQEQIVPLLDGSLTVEELVDETGLAEFEVGSALYGLIQAGLALDAGRKRDRVAARGTEVEEYRNLAIAFYRTGMLEEAEREFERVLEIEPDDFAARFHLALLAIRQNENARAVRRLRTLLDATGPRLAGFVAMAVALLREGRLSDADLVLAEAERMNSESPAVPRLRALLELGRGEIGAAERALGEYRIRLDAGREPEPIYYHTAALAAALAGELDRADGIVRQGLEAYPSSPPLLLLGGAIAERRGELDRAETAYRHAAEDDPGLAAAYKNLGDLAYRQGMFDEALEYFGRAVELEPDLGDDTYAKIGNIHCKRGARDDAVQAWRRALALNPENARVRNSLDVVSGVGA